jgi:hypothetical protein
VGGVAGVVAGVAAGVLAPPVMPGVAADDRSGDAGVDDEAAELHAASALARSTAGSSAVSGVSFTFFFPPADNEVFSAG